MTTIDEQVAGSILDILANERVMECAAAGRIALARFLIEPRPRNEIELQVSLPAPDKLAAVLHIGASWSVSCPSGRRDDPEWTRRVTSASASLESLRRSVGP